jgi:hypothetical protein
MVVKIRKALAIVQECALKRVLNEEDLDKIVMICSNAIDREEKEYEEYCKIASEAHEGLD